MVEHSNNNIWVPNDDDGDAKPLSLVYLFVNNQTTADTGTDREPPIYIQSTSD